MKKPKRYIKQGETSTFCCPECSTQLFRVSVTGGSLFINCTICNTYSAFAFTDLSKGSLTPYSADIPLIRPQQEPAVQVPATAPAAGHLSTESVNN